MNDIAFSIVTREIGMANNDFAVTDNPSVQNGGILLYAPCFNLVLPIFGVALVPQVINGARRDLVFTLNRWQQQCYQDGATLAQWSLKQLPGTQEQLINEISYE